MNRKNWSVYEKTEDKLTLINENYKIFIYANECDNFNDFLKLKNKIEERIKRAEEKMLSDVAAILADSIIINSAGFVASKSIEIDK